MPFRDMEISERSNRFPRTDPREVRITRDEANLHSPTAPSRAKQKPYIGKSRVKVYIGEAIMREANFRIGDLIKVRLNPDTPKYPVCAIVRVPSNYAGKNWRLSAAGGKTKRQLAALVGQVARAYTSFTPSDADLLLFFPNGETSYVVPNVGVTDEGILFDLHPKSE